MWQKQTQKSSHFRDSIKALEADIQHANTLATSLRQYYEGDYIQMKLSYGPFAPILLLFIDWMDFSCTDYLPSYLGLLRILIYKVYVDGMPSISSEDKKATLREFYAVVYPSLKQLDDFFTELMEESNIKAKLSTNLSKKATEEMKNCCSKDVERDGECGICLETCTKMVLPNCGHSMCNSCFNDWNVRSQSCPFCRGSLNKVGSGDLWVLTSKSDVIDILTLVKENLRNFYSYIENLPLMVPETHLYIYDYLI